MLGGKGDITTTCARGVWGIAKIMYGPSNFGEWITCQGLVACLGHIDEPRFTLVRFDAHDAASVPTGDLSEYPSPQMRVARSNAKG
jgi:hypothetical protein